MDNIVAEKPKLNTVLIYPNLKRDSKGIINADTIVTSDINEISEHYIRQLMFHIQNRGFVIDKLTCRDLDLTLESLKSALMRSVGKYHPLQGYVDSLHEIDEEHSKQSKE